MLLTPYLPWGALGSHRGQQEDCASLATRLYFQRKCGDVSRLWRKGVPRRVYYEFEQAPHLPFWALRSYSPSFTTFLRQVNSLSLGCYRCKMELSFHLSYWVLRIKRN